MRITHGERAFFFIRIIMNFMWRLSLDTATVSAHWTSFQLDKSYISEELKAADEIDWMVSVIMLI